MRVSISPREGHDAVLHTMTPVYLWKRRRTLIDHRLRAITMGGPYYDLYVDPRNHRAMLGTIKAYGKYPIQA